MERYSTGARSLPLTIRRSVCFILFFATMITVLLGNPSHLFMGVTQLNRRQAWWNLDAPVIDIYKILLSYDNILRNSIFVYIK